MKQNQNRPFVRPLKASFFYCYCYEVFPIENPGGPKLPWFDPKGAPPPIPPELFDPRLFKFTKPP